VLVFVKVRDQNLILKSTLHSDVCDLNERLVLPSDV